MKSLRQYIFENLLIHLQESAKTDPIVTSIRNELKKLDPNLKRSSSHPNEINRGKFGENDKEFSKTVKGILDTLNLKYKFDLIDDKGNPVPKFYRSQEADSGASAQYHAIKFTIGNKSYYITNKTEVDEKGAHIKHKQLSPKSLKITPDENGKIGGYTFEELRRNDFKNSLFNGLKNQLGNNDVIIQLCQDLYNSIINTENDIINDEINPLKSIEAFNEQNIKTQLKVPIISKIDYYKDYIKENKPELVQADVAKITNDYGEVLGLLLFSRIFPDVVVSFPVSANEPLIDYYVGNVAISAKNSKGGGRPSGKEVFLQARRIYESVKEEGTKAIQDLYLPEEIEFFNEVASTYELSTFKQQMQLINAFILNSKNYNHYESEIQEKAKNVTQLFNEYNIDILKFNRVADFWKVFSEIDLKKFITKLYKILEVGSKNNQKSFNPEEIINKYKEEPKKIHGYIFYPLYTFTVARINEKYSQYKGEDLDGTKRTIDIISRIFQRVNFKQAYMTIDLASKMIEVDCYSANAGKWIVTVGSVYVDKMSNSALAIELKK